MKKAPALAVLLAFLCGTVAASEMLRQPAEVPGQTEVPDVAQRGGTAPVEAVHVTVPRGQWRLYDGGFPSLQELKEMPEDPWPIYGLYVGAGSYLTFREDIKAVGFKSFRVTAYGRQPNEDWLRAMIEDDVFVILPLGAKRRDEFDSDEEYLDNALASFRQTIERYGPGGSFFRDNPDVPYKPLTCFQILNEPNFQYMYRGSNDASMFPIRYKLYSELLPRTYAMIKGNWPSATVVGWSCGGAASQDVPFVRASLDLEPAMAESFDVFATHPYMSGGEPPESFALRRWGGYAMAGTLGLIRQRFAEAGRPPGKLPVWYTEGGWRLLPEDGGMFETGDLPGNLHAAYYVRYYAMGLRLGIGRITPMHIVDADGHNGGIFNRTKAWARDDAKPFRPVAYAIQNMIRLMPNPKLVRIISDGDEGYFAYEFVTDKLDPDAGTAVMAWKVTGRGRNVRIPVPYATAVVTDMLGTSETVDVQSGTVSVEVGPYPVYVTPR